MSLTKYWLRKDYLEEQRSIMEEAEDLSIEMVKASDVESLLNDPQALAALLVERAGKEKP